MDKLRKLQGNRPTSTNTVAPMVKKLSEPISHFFAFGLQAYRHFRFRAAWQQHTWPFCIYFFFLFAAELFLVQRFPSPSASPQHFWPPNPFSSHLAGLHLSKHIFFRKRDKIRVYGGRLGRLLLFWVLFCYLAGIDRGLAILVSHGWTTIGEITIPSIPLSSAWFD